MNATQKNFFHKLLLFLSSCPKNNRNARCIIFYRQIRNDNLLLLFNVSLNPRGVHGWKFFDKPLGG